MHVRSGDDTKIMIKSGKVSVTGNNSVRCDFIMWCEHGGADEQCHGKGRCLKVSLTIQSCGKSTSSTVESQ